MFARARFSHKIRPICTALVSRVGRPGVVPAYLVLWPHSSDFGWASRTQICWPDQAIIHSFFHVPVDGLARASRFPK